MLPRCSCVYVVGTKTTSSSNVAFLDLKGIAHPKLNTHIYIVANLNGFIILKNGEMLKNALASPFNIMNVIGDLGCHVPK